MTPDQIIQLRQLIKEVREMIKCPHDKNVVPCDFCKRTRLLDEALALLPCENCGGSGVEEFRDIESDGDLTYRPCPRCRKPKKECKKKGSCTRYMDGTCEDCPAYQLKTP
ncbi:hypothetical protein LCGC14_0573900 [marine sediment metagenome]|uniref:Uncharacterized protein n=1 Tax=marine sediment metagenome TaxID=412755 RepID=A0A0F9RIC5_9ZZZZ